VTLRATQPHVTRRLAALLGDGEPMLEGATWVDELYETLEAMTPSERAAVRASRAGERGELSAELALQRGRSPWLGELLAGDGLFMAYQPVADLRSGATHGYEALARGTVGDEVLAGHQIVTAARAHDAVRQLDDVSRALALEQAGERLRGGERLFVNFDPMSVYDPEVCLRSTWATARRVGITMEQVCFEVVDAERCTDLRFLRRIFDRFRAEGATVALQDLGAEHTGVTFLRELRPDVVKLDRRLTSALEGQTARSRLVGAIIDYAHELGSTVGVVGIETESDLRCVRELGADLGQGFYLGAPSRLIEPIDPALVTESPSPARPGAAAHVADETLRDPLTGLPNRLFFQERVEELLAAGRPLAVLMLDLKAFERVNELLGHDVGDQVLITVADCLREQVGDSGSVARLGGDEFLVALHDVRSGDEAARVGHQLADAAEAATTNSELPSPRPSIGVAVAPADGREATTLLRHARAAMHTARDVPEADSVAVFRTAEQPLTRL
jgi:diguanylate cyclase (GGDEF)-like protein